MPGRTIWKGTISFGIVTIPVQLTTATEEKDIAFHQIHARDGSRIQLKRFCAAEQHEVPAEEIVKGYEYTKGHHVLLTADDLAELPVASRHAVEIAAFVRSQEIDPVYFEKSYILQPEETGLKPYALLLKALESEGVVAVARIAIRQKERLCVVRAHDGTLLLETLFYPDEVRVPRETRKPDVLVSPKELELARTLVQALEAPFDPSAYVDRYRQALLDVITAKIEGKQGVEAPAAPAAEAAPTTDIMAALRASIAAIERDNKSGAAARKPAAARRPAKPKRTRAA